MTPNDDLDFSHRHRAGLAARGQRLRQARTALGLSVKDVADRTHGRLRQSIISAIERGDRVGSVPCLVAIAAALGLSADELFPWTDFAPDGPVLEPLEDTLWRLRALTGQALAELEQSRWAVAAEADHEAVDLNGTYDLAPERPPTVLIADGHTKVVLA